MQVDCLQCNNNNALHCNVLARLIKTKTSKCPMQVSAGGGKMPSHALQGEGRDRGEVAHVTAEVVSPRTQAQLGFSEASVELLQFLVDSLPVNRLLPIETQHC